MTYKSPRTWATSDYVPAAALNTEMRDNQRWLLHHTSNPAPIARVTATAGTGIAPKQWSTINYDTAVVNRGAMWSGGSPLIAPIAGRYRIGATFDLESASCNKAARIIINAARVLCERDRPGVGSPVPARITLLTSADLDAGDFIEAEAWHDLGQPLNCVPGSWAPCLWARWVAM